MRIVGLSCGRKNSNNEILLKQAMSEAKRLSGAELEIIRLQDLTIRDCVGCETCMRGLTTGGDGLCIIRDDDMGWLKETVKDADALILASPIYDLIPTGTVITLLNRVLGIGKEYQTYCRANPKVAATIALGGSDWINLAEPLMVLTARNLSKGCTIVDKMVVGHSPAPGMVVLDTDAMERASRLGRTVGRALLEKEQAAYGGDPGVCPVCHCGLLEPKSGARVGCPLCNAEGIAEVTDGKLVVRWDEQSVRDSRFSPAGDVHHRADIAESHKKARENQALVQQRVKEMQQFDGRFLKPPVKE